LRTPDISFGGLMIDWRLLPFMIMAGANWTFHLGCHVHRVGSGYLQHLPKVVSIEKHGDLELVNMLPLTSSTVKRLGMEIMV